METVADHLKRRHLQVERYTSVYVDEELRVASFLFWNLSGQLQAMGKYRPDGVKNRTNEDRERYHVVPINGSPFALWGLETFSYRHDVLCVVEGAFDACRLHNYGIPAVACWTNSPNLMRHWLYIVSKSRRVIGVRDNDEGGRSFNKFFDELYTTTANDLGDSSETEVRELISEMNLVVDE